MGSQGERDDGDGYDSDISLSAANTQPLQPHRHSPYRPPSSALRTQTPYAPDLDLHLTSPAPLYSSPGLSHRRGRYDDYGEDVKDPGEFEESFEAGRGEDDGDSDAGQGFDTPMSFQGGFGAPPAVRLPFFPTHFPFPLLFLSPERALAHPFPPLADRPRPPETKPPRQTHRRQPRHPLCDPYPSSRFPPEERRGRVHADEVYGCDLWAGGLRREKLYVEASAV
jgi:hypothetical protein